MRIVFLLALLPGRVLACGGVFCSTGPAAAPVDQAAERILFDIRDETICTTVQIQYAGSPEAFAWVVPVPEPPVVSDGDQRLLDGLGLATGLRFQPPPADLSDCPSAFFGGDSVDSSGCGCASDESALGASASDASADAPTPRVNVFDRQQTSNYETATIGAEQASDLVAWLVENDFNVSENMVPAMQPYADARQPFLAIKLRTDRAAAQVAPLKFCYRAEAPSIPLRLTAVAAQPQMGIQVFVLAHTLFSPVGAATSAPDVRALAFDSAGQVNYSAWVARRAAHERFWSLEYAGPTPGLDARTLPRWLTTWYTRLGPEQMDQDPVFVATPELPAFSGLVDLSERAPVNSCNGPIAARLPSPCAFVYCGVGATCVDFPGAPQGCACPAEQVALPVTYPDGTSHAVCAPAANPLGVTEEDGGNPCAAVDCGQGTCVARGGFATCRCFEGSYAVSRPALTCLSLPDDARTFPEGAGPEAGNHDEAVFEAALSPGRGLELGLGGWAFLVVVSWGGLRRRRRSTQV